MELVDVAGAIIFFVLLFVLITFAIRMTERAGRRVKRARGGAPRTTPRYEWEPVTDRYSRRLKGAGGPDEDRRAMLDFLQSRSGVEAYVEPRTVMHPLSLVLVAGDGEWRRFELADDSFVKELARNRGVPVFDAARTGYPERMRKYRRPGSPRGE